MANDPHLGLIPSYGSVVRLNPQDQLLIEKGGFNSKALDIYYDLFTESHLLSCYAKLVEEIISREWEVTPKDNTPEAKKVADYVKEIINNLGISKKDYQGTQAILNSGMEGFDGLTRGLALALILGIQPAEIIWQLDKEGYPFPDCVSLKDSRRFQFEMTNSGQIIPKLLTNKNSYNGISIPRNKFIFHRYYSLPIDDPYGFGIGQALYYPVQWKREALNNWLFIIENVAKPFAIGETPSTTSEEDRRDFDSFLANLGSYSGVNLPEGFKLSFVTPESKNQSELIGELINQCDKSISDVILGENVSGEKSGTYNNSTIGNNIRIMKAKSLSDSISNCLNNSLIKWICLYRFGKNAPIPKVWRNFSNKQDISEIVNHVTSLANMGYIVDYNYIEEITGYRRKISNPPE